MSGLPVGYEAEAEAVVGRPPANDALSLVRRVAEEDGWVVRYVSPDRIGLRLRVPSPGRMVPFDVVVVGGRDGSLEASEDPASSARRLPAFCPERHINGDGTFCLFWPGENAIDVCTEESARQWLTSLAAFLIRQVSAELTRSWPTEFGWAHGDAADHQNAAELAAASVTPSLARAIRERRLGVDEKARTLLLEGRRLLAKTSGGLQGATRLVNLRRPCLCGVRLKGRPVLRRECIEHANRLVDVIEALGRMREAEQRYFAALREAGAQCCGSIDGCPLSQYPRGTHEGKI